MTNKRRHTHTLSQTLSVDNIKSSRDVHHQISMFVLWCTSTKLVVDKILIERLVNIGWKCLWKPILGPSLASLDNEIVPSGRNYFFEGYKIEWGSYLPIIASLIMGVNDVIYKHKTLFQIHNLLFIHRAENKEYKFLTFSLFLKRLQYNLSQCDSFGASLLNIQFK